MPGICSRCNRNVFKADEKIALGRVWHNFCFSCYKCRKLLEACKVYTKDCEIWCQTCHARAEGECPCHLDVPNNFIIERDYDTLKCAARRRRLCGEESESDCPAGEYCASQPDLTTRRKCYQCDTAEYRPGCGECGTKKDIQPSYHHSSVYSSEESDYQFDGDKDESNMDMPSCGKQSCPRSSILKPCPMPPADRCCSQVSTDVASDECEPECPPPRCPPKPCPPKPCPPKPCPPKPCPPKPCPPKQCPPKPCPPKPCPPKPCPPKPCPPKPSCPRSRSESPDSDHGSCCCCKKCLFSNKDCCEDCECPDPNIPVGLCALPSPTAITAWYSRQHKVKRVRHRCCDNVDYDDCEEPCRITCCADRGYVTNDACVDCCSGPVKEDMTGGCVNDKGSRGFPLCKSRAGAQEERFRKLSEDMLEADRCRGRPDSRESKCCDSGGSYKRMIEGTQGVRNTVKSDNDCGAQGCPKSYKDRGTSKCNRDRGNESSERDCGRPNCPSESSERDCGKPSCRQDDTDRDCGKPNCRQDDTDRDCGKPNCRQDNTDRDCGKPNCRQTSPDCRPPKKDKGCCGSSGGSKKKTSFSEESTPCSPPCSNKKEPKCPKNRDSRCAKKSENSCCPEVVSKKKGCKSEEEGCRFLGECHPQLRENSKDRSCCEECLNDFRGQRGSKMYNACEIRGSRIDGGCCGCSLGGGICCRRCGRQEGVPCGDDAGLGICLPYLLLLLLLLPEASGGQQYLGEPRRNIL